MLERAEAAKAAKAKAPAAAPEVAPAPDGEDGAEAKGDAGWEEEEHKGTAAAEQATRDDDAAGRTTAEDDATPRGTGDRWITFSTVGYNGFKFYWKKDAWNKDLKRVAEHIRWYHGKGPENYFDILIDCSFLSNPEQNTCNHFGGHVETMLGLIHHAKFNVVLSEFMKKMSAVPRSKSHVNILLVGPTGLKRAPGCATLLQHIMQRKSTAFHVTDDIRHMSEHIWTPHLDMGCSQCMYPRTQSRFVQVCEMALQKWEQL